MATGKKTGGRKKGTLNKATQDLFEIMGNYSPLLRLLEIAQDDETPIDTQIKINLDLLPYIYPRRKNVEASIHSSNQDIEEGMKQIADALASIE